MRLICPNCSAQYEIDASLVPDEGRDVQCSNCGHTWFELPPAGDAFDTAGDIAPSDADPEPQPEPGEDAPSDEDGDGPSHAAMAIAAASEDGEDDDAVYDPPPAPVAAPPTPEPQKRRPADAADLDILKEEAQREMSQRRAPPSEPIETQTDLGLDEIRNRKSPSRALRARMAHLQESEQPEDPDRLSREPGSRADVVTDADYQAPRRDLLPDIDEINSTLNATRKRKSQSAEGLARQQKGFRLGFLTMAILAIVLIIAYAQAPAIARAVPGAENALIPYVDAANAVRDWIDTLLGAS